MQYEERTVASDSRMRTYHVIWRLGNSEFAVSGAPTTGKLHALGNVRRSAAGGFPRGALQA